MEALIPSAGPYVVRYPAVPHDCAAFHCEAFTGSLSAWGQHSPMAAMPMGSGPAAGGPLTLADWASHVVYGAAVAAGVNAAEALSAVRGLGA